jgi:hypothetical protein
MQKCAGEGSPAFFLSVRLPFTFAYRLKRLLVGPTSNYFAIFSDMTWTSLLSALTCAFSVT